MNPTDRATNSVCPPPANGRGNYPPTVRVTATATVIVTQGQGNRTDDRGKDEGNVNVNSNVNSNDRGKDEDRTQTRRVNVFLGCDGNGVGTNTGTRTHTGTDPKGQWGVCLGNQSPQNPSNVEHALNCSEFSKLETVFAQGSSISMDQVTTVSPSVTSSFVFGPVWETWLVEDRPWRRIVRPRVPVRALTPRVLTPRRGVAIAPPYVSTLSMEEMLKELSTVTLVREMPTTVPFRGRRVLDGGVKGELGIDLSLRAGEVKKLFYAAGFTRTLQRDGIDPEDFLQEVYRGILTRNDGTCPWDHKKSSFGHYVHIVMRCLLSNYLRKDRRRTSNESLSEDGEVRGGMTKAMEGAEEFSRRELLRGMFTEGVELDGALAVVGLLGEGLSRKEVCERLSVSPQGVETILRKVRTGICE